MDKETQIKKRFWHNWNLKAITKKMLLITLGLWIVFSIGYILRDQWIKFQNRRILTAYQQGVADTVRALMNQAEACQPVSLTDGDKRIEVIKLGCGQE
jgi:hypothetical protein